MNKIDETFVAKQIIKFMEKKKDGNWHHEKTRKTGLHEHGPDIILIGGKMNSEYFIIECKGKSYAKSAKSINKEGWINALGQIVTRMNVKKLTISREDGKTITGINHAYRYGLGFHSQSIRQKKLSRRIIQIVLHPNNFSNAL